MLWFTIVFLVLLKIPLVYLVYVVWWAVRNEPEPGEGYGGETDLPGADGPEPGRGPWWRVRPPRRPPLRRGPHGSPARRPAPLAARGRSRTTS